MTPTNVVNGEAVVASQMKLLSTELFLQENYLFRRNVLNGKVEFSTKPQTDAVPDWRVLTQEALNSIIVRAKREDICEGGNPKGDIVELIHSEEVPTFNPISEYLEHLPRWDGQNHVALLFSRLPGISMEQDGGSLATDGHPARQRVCANADWCAGLW